MPRAEGPACRRPRRSCVGAHSMIDPVRRPGFPAGWRIRRRVARRCCRHGGPGCPLYRLPGWRCRRCRLSDRQQQVLDCNEVSHFLVGDPVQFQGPLLERFLLLGGVTAGFEGECRVQVLQEQGVLHLGGGRKQYLCFVGGLRPRCQIRDVDVLCRLGGADGVQCTREALGVADVGRHLVGLPLELRHSRHVDLLHQIHSWVDCSAPVHLRCRSWQFGIPPCRLVSGESVDSKPDHLRRPPMRPSRSSRSK